MNPVLACVDEAETVVMALRDPAEPCATVEVLALASLLTRQPRPRVLSEFEECGDLWWEGRTEPEEQMSWRGIQRDEFTCEGCCLVLHRSRRAGNGRCTDCAPPGKSG